jgi:hypothetical protein
VLIAAALSQAAHVLLPPLLLPPLLLPPLLLPLAGVMVAAGWRHPQQCRHQQRWTQLQQLHHCRRCHCCGSAAACCQHWASQPRRHRLLCWLGCCRGCPTAVHLLPQQQLLQHQCLLHGVHHLHQHAATHAAAPAPGWVFGGAAALRVARPLLPWLLPLCHPPAAESACGACQPHHHHHLLLLPQPLCRWLGVLGRQQQKTAVPALPARHPWREQQRLLPSPLPAAWLWPGQQQRLQGGPVPAAPAAAAVCASAACPLRWLRGWQWVQAAQQAALQQQKQQQPLLLLHPGCLQPPLLLLPVAAACARG